MTTPTEPGPRKLYRNTKEGILGGVCAGIADYLDVDKTVVRVLTVILAIVTAVIPSLIVYVIMLFLIPPRPADLPPTSNLPRQG